MDETPRIAEKLVNVSRDELLFDLEFGMKYQDGKIRQRAAVDAAVATVARMIAAHLDRAGYVERKPPLFGRSTPGSPGYKQHLTD
jgi:hypothetical protein